MPVKALFRLSAPFLLALALPLPALADPVWLTQFKATDSGVPAPWQVEQLNERIPPTRYALRLWDGVLGFEAHASKSMALLGRPVTVDLKKTPVLCWQWRIDAPLVNADMRTKAGDDYAARVYLTFSVPPDQLGFGTRTKLSLARSIYGNQVPDAAVNYVWDNKNPVNTLQPNAYTDRARMIVVRSGAGKAGGWVQERRNLLADFQRAFPGLEGTLTGLALASDTDNTGETAHAGFADFRLVANEAACPAPSSE
jgi:hypothetical protein